MSSQNSPNYKKSKLQLLQSVKSLGSFLSHSTNYWKDTFDKNFCTCNRPELDDEMMIENNSEAKKDLFKVVINNNNISSSSASNKPSKQMDSTDLVYHKEWSKRESELLIENYYFKKIKNWKKISEIIQTKSPQQCCYRIKRLEEKKKINSFTKQDDMNIVKYVDLYGKNWEKIAQHLPNYTSNLIEDRYNGKLDPFLKRTKFSSEEDEKIMMLYEKHGNNWREIANNFVDRNANMIKNRFYSVLKKKLLHYNNNNNSGTSSYVDSQTIITSSLINSIEENALDYMSNMQSQFVFPTNEFNTNSNNNNNTNNNCNISVLNKDKDREKTKDTEMLMNNYDCNSNSNDIMIDSNGSKDNCTNNKENNNNNDANSEMKDNSNNIIMFDNNSNNSGGVILPDDNTMNNNFETKMDSFNEIYHRVFSDETNKKNFEDDNIYPSLSPTLLPNSNSILNNDNNNINVYYNPAPDEMMADIYLNTRKDMNHMEKINQTDSLFIESQKLEEILFKIDQEEEVIINNDFEALFPTIESEHQQFNELLKRKGKLAKYKEMLHVKLKKHQNDYKDLKKSNDSSNIPQMLRKTLIEINDVLLKLISVGKLRIILKKQIYDLSKQRNHNYNSNNNNVNEIALSNINLNDAQSGK